MLNSIGMEAAVGGRRDLSPAQGVCTRHRMMKSQWGSALGKPSFLGCCYRFSMLRAKCPLVNAT